MRTRPALALLALTGCTASVYDVMGPLRGADLADPTAAARPDTPADDRPTSRELPTAGRPSLDAPPTPCDGVSQAVGDGRAFPSIQQAVDAGAREITVCPGDHWEQVEVGDRPRITFAGAPGATWSGWAGRTLRLERVDEVTVRDLTLSGLSGAIEAVDVARLTIERTVIRDTSAPHGAAVWWRSPTRDGALAIRGGELFHNLTATGHGVVEADVGEGTWLDLTLDGVELTMNCAGSGGVVGVAGGGSIRLDLRAAVVDTYDVGTGALHVDVGGDAVVDLSGTDIFGGWVLGSSTAAAVTVRAVGTSDVRLADAHVDDNAMPALQLRGADVRLAVIGGSIRRNAATSAATATSAAAAIDLPVGAALTLEGADLGDGATDNSPFDLPCKRGFGTDAWYATSAFPDCASAATDVGPPILGRWPAGP